MVPGLILTTVFLTSILSGILGMAGGMILMAALVWVYSVAAAMILHGAVQATANGSRAWFLRKHIRWRILPHYATGALLAVAVFALLAFVPHPGIVLIVIGTLPWLARFSQRLNGLNILNRSTAVLCGVLITTTQLLAGASGPLLDMFYVNTPLTRHEIVASKALTQTIGHLIKVTYYGLIIGVASEVGGGYIALAMAIAILGTRLGTWLLDRWSDKAFQRVSRLIILVIASVCIGQGIVLLAG